MDWPRPGPAGLSRLPVPSGPATRATRQMTREHRTPVAQRNERCPAMAEDAGSIPAGRLHADVAQTEEHRVASPGRPVRSGSSALEGPWCNGEHAELQPRWSGFDSWWACLQQDRRGPERLGYLLGRGRKARRFEPADPNRTPRPRRTPSAAGRNGTVIDYASTGRGFESRPGRHAPVAQLVEQFRAVTTRPRQHLSTGCGPDWSGSRESARPGQGPGEEAAGSSPASGGRAAR